MKEENKKGKNVNEVDEVEEEEVKEEKQKATSNPEVVNLEGMVNSEKAERARKAVFGGAKAGSNELVLMSQIRANNPKISNNKLVLEIYKGLGGLVDVKKAEVNRKNEAKAKARKQKV